MAVLVSILLALSALASGALWAEFQAGYYAIKNSPSLDQPAPPKLSPDSNYAAGAYPIAQPSFAAGEGLQEVKAYCNTCHSPRYIPMQPPLTAAAWDAEVNKMAKSYGAAIPDDAKQKIIGYLQSHFTPETRKH